MSDVYRVYTVESGTVTDGAVVEQLTIRGAGITIPAVLVGERGRGREQGALPIGGQLPLIPCPERGKTVYTTKAACHLCGTQLIQKAASGYNRQHPDDGEAVSMLLAASIGTTKTGKPKLFVGDPAQAGHGKVILVLRTKIGYRGGNQHTGDRTGEQDADGYPVFAPFPGQELVSGIIADGAAGRMGRGRQLVAVMKEGDIFRTSYSGQLYGAPGAHYYQVAAGKVVGGLTWNERCASDIF